MRLIINCLNLHLRASNASTAREDPTSPRQTRNIPESKGYVGQAARPPEIPRAGRRHGLFPAMPVLT